MEQKKTMWLSAGLSVFGLVFVGGVAIAVLRGTDTPAPAKAVESVAAVPAVAFSAQQAVVMAQQKFSQEHVDALPELVNYNGTLAYELVLKQGKVYVDASTGQWLNLQRSASVEARNDKADKTYPSKRKSHDERRENHHEEEEDDNG